MSTGGLTGAGSGFTSRMVTASGDNAEDRIVTSAGSYTATAPGSNNEWLMQVVAFKQ